MNAIPEFETRTWTTVSSQTLQRPIHHPNCLECCAVGRCHWCLNRPESGTITATVEGYVYSACAAHHNYFAEMQASGQPHAGVDLTAGLAGLSISPLTR